MDKLNIKGNWEGYKSEILAAERDGDMAFLDYLDKKTDFKTAPASTKFHLNVEGGLCLHHLNVLEAGRIINKVYQLEIKDSSIIMACLLHDLCKINMYIKKDKWDGEHKEKTGQWRKIEAWAVEDQLPLGHGEKSAIIASNFFKMTNAELAAIRWHMAGSDAGVNYNFPSGFPYRRSMDKYPLLKVVIIADRMAELKEKMGATTDENLLSDLPF